MRNLLIGILIVALFILLIMVAQGIGESFGHGLREIDVR